jgi:hypothetical protein
MANSAYTPVHAQKAVNVPATSQVDLLADPTVTEPTMEDPRLTLATTAGTHRPKAAPVSALAALPAEQMVLTRTRQEDFLLSGASGHHQYHSQSLSGWLVRRFQLWSVSRSLVDIVVLPSRFVNFAVAG